MIKSWSRASRKQLSRFVLKLLGIKSSPNALRILNEWMEISPNGTYRTTSWNAFRQAAIRKGMTVEELADQIIPTFGFNNSAEKEVSYGTRTFRVTLNPDFTLSVFDLEKQKVSKSLPAPTKHDDRKKAEKAREELSTLNKVVKTQTKIQRKRLEQSLKNGRTWHRKIWQTIFIENPVMRYITTGLVWGVYKEGQLRKSFRYMENGKCITADEKEFILSDDAILSLVHPVDLTSEILSGWKKQLDDLGITPLLPQLTAPVYYLSEEEKQVNTITRYSGKQVYISNIYNFETADITTRIENDILYIIDKSLNIVIQLPFVTEGNEVLLKEIYFSSLEEDEDMETIRLPKNEKLPLSAIPERIICSILNMLINAFSLEK